MDSTPPSPSLRIANILRQVRLTGEYHLLAEAIPYARFLGIGVENTTGEVLCRMRYAPMLIGNSSIPALHGGTLGGLLESAAIFELLLRTQTDRVPKIISITVDFLRSGRPQDTLAKATITRLGRRVANLQVQAWQEDRSRPIASANALFLVS
ncbi:PaaI family thioesterase [Archangium violaceum]|uniref:PaaI family thioesterase n=1 Tax=Archangium TaxID=47 RepID=UPI0009378456|nr:PaaI family thioesterase [Archangium sp. Cb G35]OJT25679.1 thioesterase [Archangium sp. Cb G35]WNG53477.1 PaaI family thioesterase [Archangium gephyra]WPB77084.1 PaaI family thioesterase [Archangium gephyra]